MYAHTAIMATGRRFRQEQPGKRRRQLIIRLDCLSAPKSEITDSVKGRAVQRCEAPFTESVISDSLQKAIRYFLATTVTKMLDHNNISLKVVEIIDSI